MFTAWQTQFAKPAATAAGNFGDLVQPIQQVSGSGTVTEPGGPVDGAWAVNRFVAFGTATASATLASNGGTSKSTGTGTVTDWHDPLLTGIGSDYWMEYTSTGGGTVVGGLSEGTRYALSSSRTVGISNTSGSESRDFTILIYDAASGGSLMATINFTATAEVG